MPVFFHFPPYFIREDATEGVQANTSSHERRSENEFLIISYSVQDAGIVITLFVNYDERRRPRRDALAADR